MIISGNKFKSTVFFITISLALAGCSSGSDPLVIDNADADQPHDAADVDSDIAADADDAETSIEEFSKPDTDDYFEITDPASYAEAYDREGPGGSMMGPVGRPHMKHTSAVLESWLYPGEYFVVDKMIIEHRGWLPSDIYMMVVHQGDHLPSRVVEVDDEFPAIDEIEGWDEGKFGEVHVVSRDNEVPFNFTVVIPPWAFPDTGAYNIQLLSFPIWDPWPERFVLSGGPTHLHQQSHTIYYGDTEFNPAPEAIEDRQEEAVEWESSTPGPVTNSYNLLLTPSVDICDWRPDPATPHAADCLSEVITAPEVRTTLQFYVAGSGENRIGWDTRGQNMYYVMRDDEIIDVFLLDPGEEASVMDLYEGSKKGVVLPINVRLTRYPAAYQVVSVGWPFRPQRDDGHLTPLGNRPVNSNPILMNYDPDQGE